MYQVIINQHINPSQTRKTPPKDGCSLPNPQNPHRRRRRPAFRPNKTPQRCPLQRPPFHKPRAGTHVHASLSKARSQQDSGFGAGHNSAAVDNDLRAHTNLVKVRSGGDRDGHRERALDTCRDKSGGTETVVADRWACTCCCKEKFKRATRAMAADCRAVAFA